MKRFLPFLIMLSLLAGVAVYLYRHRPPRPPTIEDLLAPSYTAVFGQERDAELVLNQADNIMAVRRLLATQSQRPVVLSALRMCTILEQAIVETRAAVDRFEKNDAVAPSVLDRERGGWGRRFFTGQSSARWRMALAPYRAKAEQEWFTLLRLEQAGDTLQPAPELEDRLRLVRTANRARHAQPIRVMITRLDKEGVFGSLYVAGGLTSELPGLRKALPMERSYKLTGKTIFLRGVTGVYEGESIDVNAYRDGMREVTDPAGNRRTMEQWEALPR